ncbi:NUDIX domain-containing protein [uncultured Fluviicola sp.]|uniref:NUDIX hydrolase n=1 Tax=uncultured Fluviicola sp. TaxID=463303 RepID=UPI0025D8C603|nr:NUDIX domain-containing protein [uncultured Fluviicola sp.]
MKNKLSGEQFKIYIAAYLVLLKKKEVLLLRRFNTGYRDGMYSLVAGHLEHGETAEQCIIREAKEEADITLLPEDLLVKHVMHRRTKDREYIDVYVTAANWNGTIQNMEPHKCDDLSWFSMDSLPENTIDEVVFALKNIEQGIFYSNFGWS